MQPIAALLFDLDDTLLDADVAWRAGVTGLIEARSPRPIDLDLGMAAWNDVFNRWFDPYLEGRISLEASRTGRIRDWAAQLGLDVPPGSELDWFGSYVVGYRDGWARFADVDPLLAGLAGLPLGLITNGDGALQRAKVDALGLTDRFGAILVSDEFGSPKPDPAIFRAAAHELGIPASQCLMIGDRLDRDVSGALAAGMRAAWIQRPNGPDFSTAVPPELAGRFTTLTTLTEILPMLGVVDGQT